MITTTTTTLVPGSKKTSKIKHAIKLKTTPARLAQLLQPSLAFLACNQRRRPGLDGTPSLAAS